ncbi:hypothetical protein [Ammoniphilus resinae]|uniref:Uncharacterized protein n=1 Tax=Ammoniphilus resinae TaxID=861532 RepID=A0ABS4GMB1_9BACL|nr:hypothetical protein [Ammoniphilus resinae]MBP1931406.1 hypothetical protein [Ammoniphilus resinae]
MTIGRMNIASKHTVVPREELHYVEANGQVVNYQLSEEELAKYRALPSIKEKKSVFIIPMRKKM